MVTQASGINAFPETSARKMTALYDGYITINRFDSESSSTAGIKVLVNDVMIALSSGSAGSVNYSACWSVTFFVNKDDTFYYDVINGSPFSNDPDYESSWVARWYK